MGAAPPFPNTSSPTAPGGELPSQPSPVTLGSIKDLAAADMAPSETCDTLPFPGPLECQLCPGTPALGRSFVKGDSHQGLGQGGGKGRSPRGLAVVRDDSVHALAGWYHLCHRVTCPHVMETLTLLRTHVARVALGKNHPHGSDLHC